MAPEKKQREGEAGSYDFLIDTLDLFEGRSGGHMAKYAFRDELYPGDPAAGTVFWRDAVMHPSFPANREKGLIQAHAAALVTRIPEKVMDITVCEIGVGEIDAVEQKTLPFLELFNRNARAGHGPAFNRYVAIDTHAPYAKDAAHLIAQKCGVITETIVSDFAETRVKSKGSPVLGMIWGGTLWNLPSVNKVDTESILISQFKRIANCLGDNSYLLITHYDDTTQMLSPYKTEPNKRAVKSILHAIKSDLDTNLSPDNFDVDIAYNSRTKAIEMNAVANKNHKLRINGVYDRKVSAGDKFNLVNSFRLTKDEVSYAADISGFRTIDYVADPKQSTGLFLMHHPA